VLLYMLNLLRALLRLLSLSLPLLLLLLQALCC
jgi:hypothetical protein